MMTPRIILAALAATLIFASPADARQAKYKSAGRAQNGRPAPAFDAAAVPAYPTAEMPGRGARQAHGHAAKSPRTGDRGAREAKASPAGYKGESGAGIVRSGKTGATARVSPRFAPIAQAVVDDLEARGAAIRFMGGYRKGPCWTGGLHPCGLAIDLCQTARGVVDGRCHLPSRAVEASIAAAHGALSGGVWCHQDRGHIQLGQTAGACGSNLYAAVAKFKGRRIAARHQRAHHRVASRAAGRL